MGLIWFSIVVFLGVMVLGVFVSDHKAKDQEVLIYTRKLRLGMTETEVEAAIGNPYDTNRDINGMSMSPEGLDCWTYCPKKEDIEKESFSFVIIYFDQNKCIRGVLGQSSDRRIVTEMGMARTPEKHD